MLSSSLYAGTTKMQGGKAGRAPRSSLGETDADVGFGTAVTGRSWATSTRSVGNASRLPMTPPLLPPYPCRMTKPLQGKS